MATSSNKVEIEIAAKNTAGPVVKGVADDMAAIAPAAQKAQGASDGALGSMHQRGLKASEAAHSISDQLALIQKAYVALQATNGMQAIASDLAKTADAYNNLQARIKLVTGEGQVFTSAFEQVSDIAKRTSSSIESTGGLFAKLAEAGKSAGMGTKDAIDQALALTETVNQAVQLSGASAQASDAAITQLIQGLQGGVLRGDEFNSVMEQAPRLAKSLADGLGVTTGALRKMAEAGQLSSDTVIKALKGQADTVAGEFSKLPPTVGRALQNLSTSWTLYVGETDKATGASKAAATVINSLATNLNTIAGYLIDAGQAATAFAAIKLAQHFTGIATAATSSAAAVAANNAAMMAAGAASTTAAASVGRFASILSSLKTFTLLGIITNFHDIGTAIGEGAAKLMGYKDRTEELARAEKVAAQISADAVEQRERMVKATKDATDANYGLSKAAKASITTFDEQTTSGKTAAEAVASIGKNFNLATIPGIKDAASVLDKLAADGKISSTEFQAAWAEALKGQDLAAFEVKFIAAMQQTKVEANKASDALQAAIARGVSGKELEAFETKARVALAATGHDAERLAQVMDASLRESIRRTGLDFDVISGGMGKASASAINDTDAMIKGLDRLKAMGVDTSQALVASIGKGIDTAESQKAIEAVRIQIEAVRKVLGDKVADGLLEQAKQKATELSDTLEKAKPGINSLREAMKELGLKSRDELQATAKKAEEAYGLIKAKGQEEGESYVAWQARKQQAAQVMLERMIAANSGLANETIKTRAAMEGLEIATDSAGKAIVRAMGSGKQATDSFTVSVNDATSALERQNAAQERANAAAQKAIDLENKRLNRDKEGFSLNTAGERINQSAPTERSTYENAKSQGLSDAQALAIARQFVQNGNQVGWQQDAASGGSWSTAVQKAIDKVVLENAGKAASEGKSTPISPVQQNTYTVNIPGFGNFQAATARDANNASTLIAQIARAKLSA